MDISDTLDIRLAERLKGLRKERGWSLDALAQRSGVSRATLSRIEKAEVSATTQALAKLCAAHEISLSRLLHMAEEAFQACIPQADQPLWTDEKVGFVRRSVSPPAAPLAGEVIEAVLKPGAEIGYDEPPRAGLEHHLVMLEGSLTISLQEDDYTLGTGDCLRYQLFGRSRFYTSEGARYLLFLV